MRRFFVLVSVLLAAGLWAGEPLTPEQKAKVDSELATLKAWGTQAEFVTGVQTPAPAWAASMTQDKWTALSILSPEVKELAKNTLGAYLRTIKDPAISEIFVSRADGTKAAYLAKPTNWSHKGKPKHDIPMTGKVWIGEVETDESTGLKQVQISFPILDKKAVVGSVVVGLQLSKL